MAHSIGARVEEKRGAEGVDRVASHQRTALGEKSMADYRKRCA